MQETHQYSTDIPQRDLSTSSHLDFIRCPSDAFYLLNIPFLSMTTQHLPTSFTQMWILDVNSATFFTMNFIDCCSEARN
ncbi:hypothetical protein T05_1055 [Trichinella murrelli]|uniref:Uncharacterized protein n=1 Tax=Trichinella murrelli TaxID=144512 RepID=A0A0V0TNB8_9BILA|nr:hypothetical protein T05_1055 [Trichinella murrelli]